MIFPSQLYDFLQCRHIISLMRMGVTAKSRPDEEIELLRQRGYRHEKHYLESLTGEVIIIDDQQARALQKEQTHNAMLAGADTIYQAYLEEGDRAGHVDFLIKTDTPSKLGNYSYIVADTKLALYGKPEHIIQLVHYSELLTPCLGKQPEQACLIFGDMRREDFAIADFIYYYREVLNQYRKFLQSEEETTSFPISYCRGCRFNTHCHEQWQAEKSLALIAGIRRADALEISQKSANNYEDFADTDNQELQDGHFGILRQQASSLKEQKLILRDEQSLRKLQEVSPTVFLNIYHHISHYQGVEMFALGIYLPNGERFEFLQALTPEEEKKAFQRLISFLMRIFNKNPQTKLITFAQSQTKLLHNLSSRFNTCTEQVDWLIQMDKIKPLQALIRQSFFMPINSYQLQDIVAYFSPELAIELSDQHPAEVVFEGIVENNAEEASSALKEKMLFELKILTDLHFSVSELKF